jgi:ATP-dependent DNA helicase RecG
LRGELTDITELKEGDEATVVADIKKVNVRRAPGRIIVEVIITDGSADMALTFFNQAWREKQLKVGMRGMFAGKVGIFNGKRQLSHPDYEILPEGGDEEEAAASFAGKALPVYPATTKLPSWKIAQSIEIALDSISDLDDPVPAHVLKKFNYPQLREAFLSIHQPTTRDEADIARARLTFDEALVLQLLLAQRKAEVRSLPTKARGVIQVGLVSEFENLLPFTFTDGQREVIAEIEEDMAKSYPMHRLLQGEVGSGKTVVALRAMLTAVDSGGQAALLAPTEVLAAQHYSTIHRILGPLASAGTLGGSEHGTRVVLLTGSMSVASKRAIHGEISSGHAGIVIGTHALLSEGVNFKELGLVVVDEQHRFGVEQRDALREKAEQPPHLLVMTATPIPRTVAMTVFGDLDVSTLRQLPAGRPAITSHLVPALDKPHFLDRAWQRIREEVEKGHQAYVVAPRISATESEDSPSPITARDREVAAAMGVTLEQAPEPKNMYAVEELAPMLALGPLKGLRIAPLHGRQSAELKEETMRAFSEGKIDVLVSTTVIEVGVDVANASVMVIMNADRFGVSQLHQLRGRVGRGKVAGLCLFVTEAEERISGN